MRNYASEGATLDYTAGADIEAGQLVLIGTLLAVATTDLAASETGTVRTVGVFVLPKVDSAIIEQGETLAWDYSARSGKGAFATRRSPPATGYISGPCAVAWESKGASTDDTIRVKLTGLPGELTDAEGAYVTDETGSIITTEDDLHISAP